jgi:hypothetical protein
MSYGEENNPFVQELKDTIDKITNRILEMNDTEKIIEGYELIVEGSLHLATDFLSGEDKIRYIQMALNSEIELQKLWEEYNE